MYRKTSQRSPGAPRVPPQVKKINYISIPPQFLIFLNNNSMGIYLIPQWAFNLNSLKTHDFNQLSFK